MKKLILVIYLSITLHAGLFTSNTAIQSKMLNSFREISHDANAIVKKGDYKRYSQYKIKTELINKNINSLNISDIGKTDLKRKLQTYSNIVNSVYENIKNKTPDIDKNYALSLNGLSKFNNAIVSTGYKPLIKEWNQLTKIKYKFIKKPDSYLEKNFYEKFNSVEMVLLDLCVDEEEELLSYLKIYKNYFRELSLIYKSVKYSNIHKIKPLSYNIKSKLEFVTE